MKKIKNLVYGGQTRSKKSRFFPNNEAILIQSAILISRNKVSCTKVRYQKYASNAEKKIGKKLCLLEQKYENLDF
jgi:hypothetical protein